MRRAGWIPGTIYGCNVPRRIHGAACATMAALIGAGLLDRFPRLRLGCLEAGHGWLPFWMARLGSNTWRRFASALPADLKHHPSEYRDERADISEHRGVGRREGDQYGGRYRRDNVLMYASDYPHGESALPNRANIVLGWKNMAENASASCSGTIRCAFTHVAVSWSTNSSIPPHLAIGADDLSRLEAIALSRTELARRVEWDRIPHDFPHSQMAPNICAKRGWAASIWANRLMSGSRRKSVMFGMSS